jgi:recombination protein RecA
MISKSQGLLKIQDLIERGIAKVGNGEWAVPSMPTGVEALDQLIGGWPEQRLIEMFGLQGTGKTTLVYHAMAANKDKLPLVECGFVDDPRAKKSRPRPVRAVVVDSEGSFDPLRLEALGFPRDEVGIVQPQYGEQGLAAIEAFAATGVRLIVIDGVSGLIPAKEMEKGYEDDQQPGAQAKMYNQFFRRYPKWDPRPTVLVVNQMYAKIGAPLFADPWSTAGGMALKYVATMRLQMRTRMKLKKGERVLGQEVAVRVEKNKLGPSYGETILYLVFKLGYVGAERWERIRAKKGLRVEVE